MTSSERKAKRLTMITKDTVSGQEMCNLCGATFVYSKTLHDHIDSKHLQILAYSCKYCPKRFTNRGNKYAHESQIHRYDKKYLFETTPPSPSGNEDFCSSIGLKNTTDTDIETNKK